MTEPGKRSVHSLLQKKRNGERIVCLTAYDCPLARIEQEAGIDLILVGDSINMAVLGDETTLGATMDLMIAHTRAVRRGAPETLVVGDMPFGSYQPSEALAIENAMRFLVEGGADAVKLEGGSGRALERVEAILDSGIPVMGHIGLLPQSLRKAGGYRVVGSSQRDRLMAEGRALADAGAFAVVVESVEEALAREITDSIEVPTIGIGAGRYTDGQVLVVNDVLGMSGDFAPRFVRKYAELGSLAAGAVNAYVRDVREGSFPAREHCYKPVDRKDAETK
ncbi:3-methyl-2-oxobutanoate hydroxymethyltransferase [Candidatus Fermentibacterales bacterium]|nr:3-methyl-2-oxobutanoate hydroxymethyltransferase [Candidatus Fermentibacterales bacterium]